LSPEDETAARFAELQSRLAPLWRSIREMTDDEQTIVVVPSMSVDVVLPGALQQAMEERFLFLLLLLRQPRARMVYVTSQRINPSIVEYYLDLLPGVLSSHATKRLHLLAPEDGTSGPLSAKLLARPRLLAQIRALIADPQRAHLVPYATTEMERDLALELGIPLYGADPKYLQFGTKTGGRRLFEEEGVPYPLGAEGLRSLPELVEAVRALRQRRPGLRQAIVKLNEGVSGLGNASVDLAALPAPGTPDEPAAIEAAVRAMSFESGNAKLSRYLATVEEDGAVVEERLEGTEFRSPSVQLRVTPLGDVELLSTHDQLLGGPSGQAYLGCVFPADPAYAPLISREAMKIGRRLAREGVLGRFALDFVAVREAGGAWQVYAIEINLRKGGTTHPFLTLQFLTDGRYDAESAAFTAPSGRHKHFVASDHVESEDYRAFTPDDLFDVLVRRRLHFDQSRQTGVVLHMLAAVAERGRFGLTAVGDSAAEAQAIYERAIAVLDEEARAALAR
jgi:hypothetical protein